MKVVVADTSLIAYCGLYCGACGKYLKEKCPGCHDNVKAGWCGVRTCCMEHGYASCSDCTLVEDITVCGKLNNFISKLFGLLFRSDRLACLAAIRVRGYEDFARTMAEKKIMTFRK